MLITIRPLQELDAYTSIIWRNDPDVFKYTGNVYKNEIKIQNELEWIRKAIANNSLGKDYRCAILVDDIYVGNVYLTNIDGINADYHIFIGDKNYWGKGIAKHASILILKYAFETLNLNQVRLRVKKENDSAYNLYKKLGFEEILENDGWTTMVVENK